MADPSKFYCGTPELARKELRGIRRQALNSLWSAWIGYARWATNPKRWRAHYQSIYNRLHRDAIMRIVTPHDLVAVVREKDTIEVCQRNGCGYEGRFLPRGNRGEPPIWRTSH